MPKLRECSKHPKFKRGDRVSIPVGALEFIIGQNTIWVQSPLGATVMRIKCAHGKHISASQCNENPVSHSDVITTGDIEFCLADDAE